MEDTLKYNTTKDNKVKIIFKKARTTLAVDDICFLLRYIIPYVYLFVIFDVNDDVMFILLF
jgi:hypothetical protein